MAQGDRLLTYRGVTREFTLSEATIRRLIAAGKFPPPERLTVGRVIFRESSVREAIERLIAEQRALRSPGKIAKACDKSDKATA